MGEVDAGHLLEHLHGQMMLAAVADRAIEQGRLGGAGKLDEGAEIDRPELGIGRQQQRIRHQARDRGQVLERIDRHLGIEVRIDAEQRARPHQQGVAVRIGAGHQLAGEIAVRARPILHHDRLAEACRQRHTHGARHQIAGAARRIHHQEPDRPIGEGLREGRTRERGARIRDHQGRQNEADQA
jgi:hypothetical protein